MANHRSEVPKEIDKKWFWQYVMRKLNGTHINHVYSIINILFDEILADLKKGKRIRIFNFGTLFLDRPKPRRHFDVKRRIVVQSKGHPRLNFVLRKLINKWLRAMIDPDTVAIRPATSKRRQHH